MSVPFVPDTFNSPLDEPVRKVALQIANSRKVEDAEDSEGAVDSGE